MTTYSQRAPFYNAIASFWWTLQNKNAKNCLFVRVRECISGPPTAGLIVTPVALEVI